VATGFLPGFFVYWVLCLSMPEGEAVATVRRAYADPVRPNRMTTSFRYLAKMVLRVLIAMACGGGVGAIVGATCQMIGRPWHDEVAALLGIGSGVVTTGIMMCVLCLSLGKPYSIWPALATIVYGVGTGLVTGGLLMTSRFWHTSDQEVVAAFGGLGAGLLVAAFAGYLIYSILGRSLGWRWVFVVLYLGAGAGFAAAACGGMLGANEMVVALSSCGAGLLTAGGLAWLLALGNWAERLRPVAVASASSDVQQNLKKTMTWYGSNDLYRPIVLGSSLFLTVLLVAWSGAYAAYWLAGSRQPLHRVMVLASPPRVIDWEVNRFGGHRATVDSIAFDRSGKRLATGDSTGVIKVWDFDTAKELRSFSSSYGTINAMAFHPNGIQLAVGANSQGLRIWNVETGAETANLGAHPGHVNSVAFSPDGSKVATGSTDEAVRLFDSTTGEELYRFFGCNAEVGSVAFFPDGNRLIAVGHNDRTIRIWDIGTRRQLKPLPAPNGWLRSFVLSPEGGHVAARDFGGSVVLWDTRSGSRVAGFTAGASSSSQTLSFSPDGSQVLSANWSEVRLHDAHSGHVLCSFKGHTGQLTAVAFHPNGDSIVTAGSDGTVRLWEVPEELRRPHRSSAYGKDYEFDEIDEMEADCEDDSKLLK
jgi:MFS family permease